jgi:tRNA(Ile)-lysidine synthase
MPATPRVAVAASGGPDSTALLHCTLRQAHALGVEVVALHVHHGLMPQADAWLAQVRSQARRWGAGFDSRRLQGPPQPGQSVEAWARAGRYAALAEMAQQQGCCLLLLAHHRRDQAETWLLQALRGGGPRGLAAMPRQAPRAGLIWCRPWLDQPREAIDAYLHRHRLRSVTDTSNADPRFARSRLRQQVWPALTAAFADAETSLSAAAQQAQHALALADEVLAQDLPPLLHGDALLQERWLALPPARRRNTLQGWLDLRLPAGVPGSLLARLCAELPAARNARWPAPGGELRLYRGRLCSVPGPGRDPGLVRALTRPAGSAAAASSGAGASQAIQAPQASQPVAIDANRPGRVTVPGWAGELILVAVTEGGAAPALLQHAVARPRQGGEQFQQGPAGQPRSLKKQYQAAAVPAWQREGPLLYTRDGRLLFVPGLGLDGRCLAPPGGEQLGLHWRPDAPVPGPVATGHRQRSA